jgi:hypothetical protein
MARQRAGDARAAFARVGALPLPPVEPEAPAVPPPPPVSPTQAPRDVMTPRRRGGAPEAATAIALTVRFDPDEAYENDDFFLMLRRQLRRARLDKAEVVRALVRVARTRPEVRQALLDELRIR